MVEKQYGTKRVGFYTTRPSLTPFEHILLRSKFVNLSVKEETDVAQ